MFRKLITILFFSFSALTFAQTSETYNGKEVNVKDAGGMKQGHWVILNTANKFPEFKDGQLVEEGDYIDNKKNGIWTKYYPNGNKKHELTFVNNIPNGYAKFYYKDGVMSEEGMWKDNTWIGEYRYYHENGNLFYNWVYNAQGKREGKQQYFYENGNLMIEGNWKEGNENGVIREYHEDGSLKAEKTLAAGKIDPAVTKSYEKGIKFDDFAPKAKQLAESITKQNQPQKIKAGNTPVMASSEVKEKSLEYIGDGEKTTYNKFGKPSLVGTFKNSTLVQGKEYVYTTEGVYQKTNIIQAGKKVSEVVEK